jgi:hypothetical protein
MAGRWIEAPLPKADDFALAGGVELGDQNPHPLSP